jgi:uncharacterized membrane protein YccC
MTALLVLKPGVTDTVNRAVARVLCMLAGAILVSFCIAHLNPAPVVLASFHLTVRMVILWHRQCELRPPFRSLSPDTSSSCSHSQLFRDL